MKEYSKKFFIFIMCGWLCFSSSFIVYEKSYCYAMEWAGVVAGLDTAFKFMLGLLGVSVGVGVADQIDWGTVRNDCMNFQENQGNSAVAVSEWWSDICDGAIDTSSDCFSAFKDWVNTKIQDNNTQPPLNSPTNPIDLMNNFLSIYGTNGGSFSSVSGELINITFATFEINNSQVNYHFFSSPDSSEISINGNRLLSSNNTIVRAYSGTFNLDIQGNNNVIKSAGWSFGNSWTYTVAPLMVYFGIDSISNVSNYEILGGTSSEPIEDNIFQSITKNISNLTIVNKGDTIIEGDNVVTIPWENVGDDIASIDNAIDELIDKVNEGVITIGDYCNKIQNISNTYVYDTTNNYIFPDDKDSIEDKINENKSNEGFTLFGLEKFFPFCIPWDLYAFLGILEASPQAPQIPVPMPNVKTKQIDTYIIDMSPLEPIAVVLRYGFDFMFIIGLALASRRLIGAGGSE